MSDAAMTYRIVVKEIAAEHGVYATFMPKPLFGENGSGMHTHQSLFSGGKNAFYDAEGDHHLSEAAKSYIAGLLRHAREIAALFAPNVNSYKRLVPGYEAPVYCAGRRGTARRSFACRCITPARSRRPAASSAVRTPPAIRT